LEEIRGSELADAMSIPATFSYIQNKNNKGRNSKMTHNNLYHNEDAKKGEYKSREVKRIEKMEDHMKSNHTILTL
jgi:hypothetical protein